MSQATLKKTSQKSPLKKEEAYTAGSTRQQRPSPVWPLKSAIACKSLLHMEEQNFWQAFHAIRFQSEVPIRNPAVTRDVNAHMIKWLESYLDTGISKMQMVRQKEGFYATWRDLAGFDNELIRGPKDKNIISSMPAVPSDAVEWALQQLGLHEDEVSSFLAEQLTSLRGWSGYIRWHSQWNGDPAKPDISLEQYMAARLGTYLIASKKTGLQEEPSREISACQKQISMDSIVKNEQIFAENFLGKMSSKPRPTNINNTLLAQWIFCIDVRSEP
jgi:uncharacterized protein YbcC (UPF0753/DUF2309 family)